MWFTSTSSVGFLLGISLLTSAGQIPVVDGVLGGVRATPAIDEVAPAATTTGILGPPTAGALRFVENTGICGLFPMSG